MEDAFQLIAAYGIHTLDLGAYPQSTQGAQMERWISLKALPSGELSFSLERKSLERFIPLSETAPFPALEKLPSARFESVAGNPGIWIAD